MNEWVHLFISLIFYALTHVPWSNKLLTGFTLITTFLNLFISFMLLHDSKISLSKIKTNSAFLTRAL